MKNTLDEILDRFGERFGPVAAAQQRALLHQKRREEWTTNRPPAERKEKPRCGARTRGARGGRPCQAQGLGAGGRCKFHGGMSTGPRTEEGRARALANLRQNAKASKGADDMRVRIVRRADVGQVNEQRQAAADHQHRREVRAEIMNGRPGVRQAVETFDNGASITFDSTARKFAVLDASGEFHGFRRDREAAAAFAQSLKRKEEIYP